MTLRAESDQIVLGVRARLTAKPDVVNLQLRRSPAALTAPAVALEHLLTQVLVRICVESDRALFWTNPVHEAALMESRNLFFCG